MKLQAHPFTLIDWNEVEAEEHKGISGYAYWKTKKFGDIRVRLVEYSPDYLADHWCNKGHFIYCIEGEMVSELNDGRKSILKEGMAYHVGDDSESHRSYTEKGVKLFIVD